MEYSNFYLNDIVLQIIEAYHGRGYNGTFIAKDRYNATENVLSEARANVSRGN